MINIVCTSKPVDGLFFYSYEYCSLLNVSGVDAKLIIICHKKFKKDDYINSINSKYIHCENIFFDNFTPNSNDISLIMGRSMLTLSWIEFNFYTSVQQQTLKALFSKKLISVYSNNHPLQYLEAIKFYSPRQVVDLCDKEVYPDGVGEHFEKKINFDIYKNFTYNKKFEHLFLGTNDKYYQTIEQVIDQYPSHGILTYNFSYINTKNNNIFVPIENLMGIFDVFVYTKNTFDPAPRILQECKYFNKKIIYQRSSDIIDGGSVYYQRKLEKPNLEQILKHL